VRESGARQRKDRLPSLVIAMVGAKSCVNPRGPTPSWRVLDHEQAKSKVKSGKMQSELTGRINCDPCVNVLHTSLKRQF